VSAGPGAFPWDDAVAARARAIGLVLPADAVRAIVAHARSVLRDNGPLHLTAIDDPETFVERHIGESLEGAALLPMEIAGTLVDLGSGNGFPGIPIAIARPGLALHLVESSEKKAMFLRTTLRDTGLTGVVVARHVTRAPELPEVEGIDVLVTRAMGDWERVLPRVATKLATRGKILLWAVLEADRVIEREAWRRLRLVERRPLLGRERSFIYELSPGQ